MIKAPTSTMEVLAEGYGLIEGPVFDPARGLLFSDVIGGGVFRLDPDARTVSPVLAHRRGIGGMTLHARGGLIVSGRNVSWKSDDDQESAILVDQTAVPDAVGFNDLTTDPDGRVYVGSLAFSPVTPDSEPRPGHLHVIDLDGSVRTVADDVKLTNGLGVSPDGSRLYHSDSLAHVVWVYPLDGAGQVGAREVFAEVPEGHADGLALAEDGSVWVAVAGGSCVLAFEPDGSRRMRLDVPLPMVTSLCFGGADRCDLYVVTGSRGAGRENAGTVFRTRVDVPGLEVHPARVALL